MELQVPMVLNLEGGYHPEGSVECIQHTLDALTGLDCFDEEVASTPSHKLISQIDQSMVRQQKAINDAYMK